MQTYLKTHAWITFRIDLEKANYKLWLLLGQAQSKCEHIADSLLPPSVRESLHEIYLAKGVQASTAIEGNTLAENEVLERIKGKLELPPSKAYLGTEIDNNVSACNDIAEKVLHQKLSSLTAEDIKRYNFMVLNNLPLSEEIIPGAIRKHSVGVAGYRAAPAEDCEYLLKRLCDWLGKDFEIPADYSIAFGILKAIVAHIYLAWIHPFGDGNGRTARLIEFRFLLSEGVPSAAAHLLSNHYNQTRQEYYRRLDQTSKSGGDILPFIEYALLGFVDGLKSQLNMMRSHQITVLWQNNIFEQFKDKNSKADTRRRHLALDLSEKLPDSIPLAKIRHVSPRIAEAYAGKTQKTVLRDVHILAEMNLVVKEPKGIRAKIEMLSAI